MIEEFTVRIFEAASKMSDEAWCNTLVESARGRISDDKLPSWPSEAIQKQFVGSSFDQSILEAYQFYTYVKQQMQLSGYAIGDDDVFLDFGCGWGRFIRLFAKDFLERNIFAVDVDPEILNVCRRTGVPGHFDAIEPRGRISLPDASVDLVIAYSVFTHLPEDIHLHWMSELARVIRPGGFLCFTLEPRRFLDFVVQTAREGTTDWHRGMARFAAEVPEYKERFDRGEFVYLPTSGGAYRPAETYGEAVVPVSYLRSRWSVHFDILSYLDDPHRFWQAVAIARRR
jgi:ubiquinone/menaquinone biosynthesis C-methylase UbiE